MNPETLRYRVRMLLEELMESSGLHAAEVARRAEVRRETMHGWLHGANLTLDTLEKIADALGYEVTIGYRHRS